MINYKFLLACLVFVLLWSSGWIGSKYGQEYAGPFTLLVYRYVLVVALLIVFVTFKNGWRLISRSQLILHASVGILCHAVFLGTGNHALLLGVSAGLVAFITALQPMITATLSFRISGERTLYQQWLGLALGLTAVLLVVYDKIAMGGAAIAYVLPFVAILALSLASLIDRRINLNAKRCQVEPAPLSLVIFIHCISTLLVLLPFAATVEGFEAQWGPELIFSIVWLAIVVSLGAYGMMFYLLRQLSATKVASLGYLSPPATMIIAYFMFGERLSVVDFGGLFLAAIAVWFVISNQQNSTNWNDTKIPEPSDVQTNIPRSQAFLASADAHSPTYNSYDMNDNSARNSSFTGEPRAYTPDRVRHLDRIFELERELIAKDRELVRMKRLCSILNDYQADAQSLNQALSDSLKENAEQYADIERLHRISRGLQEEINRQSAKNRTKQTLREQRVV